MQAVHASELAERAKTHARAPSRGANCSFTRSPEGPRLHRRQTSGTPFGHPNSLKIAVVPYKTYKERANDHLPLSVRYFGSPRVPKGAKMDPKWSIWHQNGPQILPWRPPNGPGGLNMAQEAPRCPEMVRQCEVRCGGAGTHILEPEPSRRMGALPFSIPRVSLHSCCSPMRFA